MQTRLDLGWNREVRAVEALVKTDCKENVGEVGKGTRNSRPEAVGKFVYALDLPDNVAKAAFGAQTKQVRA